jgi:hypothetical protein
MSSERNELAFTIKGKMIPWCMERLIVLTPIAKKI